MLDQTTCSTSYVPFRQIVDFEPVRRAAFSGDSHLIENVDDVNGKLVTVSERSQTSQSSESLIRPSTNHVSPYVILSPLKSCWQASLRAAPKLEALGIASRSQTLEIPGAIMDNYHILRMVW